jgi:hypothetical protein
MIWDSTQGRRIRFFSLPKLSDKLWGPPSLLFNGYPVSVSGRESSWRMRNTASLYVQNEWISTSSPPYVSFWSGQIKLYCCYFFMHCWPASQYNFVNTSTWCTFFSYIFISILYMFQAAMCPSSGELIVSMPHLLCVNLCRWPSGMQVGMKPLKWNEFHSDLHTRRSSTQSDIYQVSHWYN